MGACVSSMLANQLDLPPTTAYRHACRLEMSDKHTKRFAQSFEGHCFSAALLTVVLQVSSFSPSCSLAVVRMTKGRRRCGKRGSENVPPPVRAQLHYMGKVERQRQPCRSGQTNHRCEQRWTASSIQQTKRSTGAVK